MHRYEYAASRCVGPGEGPTLWWESDQQGSILTAALRAEGPADTMAGPR